MTASIVVSFVHERGRLDKSGVLLSRALPPGLARRIAIQPRHRPAAFVPLMPHAARRWRRPLRRLLVEAVADRAALLRPARHSVRLRSRSRPPVHGGHRQPPAYDRARAAVRYDDVARALVTGFKYGDRLDLAPMMGRWMARAGRELLTGADGLIPVPLHWRRLWARRFNQSAALAGAIGGISGVPVLHDALKRVRATAQQVGLSQAQRAENVQGAFRVPPEGKAAIAGRRLILIDDVLTSGATVDTCARLCCGRGRACRRPGIRPGCGSGPEPHINYWSTVEFASYAPR